MSGKIFISYRREDSRGAAGRIYDQLEGHFGHDQIFMDVDTIQPGMDFIRAIGEAVGKSDIFLAVIGPKWLNATDAAGNRRLDNPEDIVRLEVSSALRRNIRVIPVLVENATMPRSVDLPNDLKPLTRRAAIEISHTRFKTDADRLIQAMELFFNQIEAERKGTKKNVLEKSKQILRGEKLLKQSSTAAIETNQGNKTSAPSFWSIVIPCAIGGAIGYCVGIVIFFISEFGFNFWNIFGNWQLIVVMLVGLFTGAVAGFLLSAIFRRKIRTTWWIQSLIATSYVSYAYFSHITYSIENFGGVLILLIIYVIYAISASAVIHWLRKIETPHQMNKSE